MSIWHYANYLPPVASQHRVTLGEGNTPLLRSRRIGPSAGLQELYFKLENCNPTGSFKDRFAAMAVSDMSAKGAKLCLATSSGNTGSALSAGCAVAGIPCYIAVVDGAPANKLRNMHVYGAKTFSVRGFGRDPAISQGVMDRLRKLCDERQASLQISNYLHSPIGMIGCETLAYELAEQTDGRLDHVFTQAGAGGMTRAVALGFSRLVAEGKLARSPRVHCVQPEGNDTIATPLRMGWDQARDVTCTSNVSGLQVPTVIGGHDVIPACRACGGTGYVVTDDAVFAAQQRLAREEGVFAEPAGAAALAGLLAAVSAGEVQPHERIVCTVTGIGFKDEKSLDRQVANCDSPCLETVEAMDQYVGSTPTD
ncbi:MAG: pyridoxal-phosphate dependent enzyme [Pirellulales bacterium]